MGQRVDGTAGGGTYACVSRGWRRLGMEAEENRGRRKWRGQQTEGTELLGSRRWRG